MEFSAVNRRRPSRETPLGPGAKKDELFSQAIQTQATHFETVVTIVNEVSSDTTKIPDEFIFRSVLLDCFTAELDE